MKRRLLTRLYKFQYGEPVDDCRDYIQDDTIMNTLYNRQEIVISVEHFDTYTQWFITHVDKPSGGVRTWRAECPEDVAEIIKREFGKKKRGGDGKE